MWTPAGRTGVHRQTGGSRQGTLQVDPVHAVSRGTRFEVCANTTLAKHVSSNCVRYPSREPELDCFDVRQAGRAERAQEHKPSRFALQQRVREQAPHEAQRAEIALVLQPARRDDQDDTSDRHRRGKKNAPSACEDTEVALSNPAAVDEEIANAELTPNRMTQIRMELEQESDRPDDSDRHLPGDEPAPADTHMNILQSLVDLEAAQTPQRLGPAGQQPRRALEQTVRRRRSPAPIN